MNKRKFLSLLCLGTLIPFVGFSGHHLQWQEIWYTDVKIGERFVGTHEGAKKQGLCCCKVSNLVTRYTNSKTGETKQWEVGGPQCHMPLRNGQLDWKVLVQR